MKKLLLVLTLLIFSTQGSFASTYYERTGHDFTYSWDNVVDLNNTGNACIGVDSTWHLSIWYYDGVSGTMTTDYIVSGSSISGTIPDGTKQVETTFDPTDAQNNASCGGALETADNGGNIDFLLNIPLTNVDNGQVYSAEVSASPTPAPFVMNQDTADALTNFGTSMVSVAFYALLAGLAIVGGYVVSVKGFHIVLKWILGWIH